MGKSQLHCELRIGNYFQWVPHASMGIGVDQITSGQQIDNYRGFKEGITLSPEWLERFGFQCDVKDWYWKATGVNQYIASNPHGFYLSITDSDDETNSKYKYEFATKLDIQYVHQLQNLYFALTGTELQISEP